MIFVRRLLLYSSWLTALFATLGSLYFSEILQFVPCALCWYQRILMYPLVLIIPIGILRKDKGLPLYVLPLSAIGAVIALYHELLQLKILSVGPTLCSNGVSCTTNYLSLFGFLSIPLLSLIAFIFISISMLVIIKTHPKHA